MIIKCLKFSKSLNGSDADVEVALQFQSFVILWCLYVAFFVPSINCICLG
jgi:hypothetical protein